MTDEKRIILFIATKKNNILHDRIFFNKAKTDIVTTEKYIIMKTTFRLFLALIAMSFFTSCNDNDDSWNVAFTSNYDIDFDVTTQTDAALSQDTFYLSSSIYPRADRNFWYYRYYLTELSVQNVIAKITNPSVTSFTMDSCILTFYSYSNDTVTVSKTAEYSTSWTFTNQTITQGTTITFTNSNNQFETIENLFYNLSPFAVSMQGWIDKQTVTFDVELDINLFCTASY